MTSSQLRAGFFASPVSFAITLAVCAGLPEGELAAQPVPPDCSTDVEADRIQPAGVPILIHITLTNTGQAPISYWCGGPGHYPGADLFSARITDDRGKTRALGLGNGQYVMGSGGECSIAPGKSVTLPAAAVPLPPGSYTVQVGKGKSAEIIVKDDLDLVRTREQDILKRIRQGEPFAQHVARTFPTDPLRKALLEDLLSKDQKVALYAARTLERVVKLPADSGAAIKKAMQMHLEAEEKKNNRETHLLVSLAFVAAHIGDDDALSAVLSLAHSGMGTQTRESAIYCLGTFKQEGATKALRDLLNDKDERVRLEAARILAYRKEKMDKKPKP